MSSTKRTLAAEQRQVEAEASGLLNAYRAARYLGISASAFNGWVFRYKIASQPDEKGKPLYRLADLDEAKLQWNAIMVLTGQKGVRLQIVPRRPR